MTIHGVSLCHSPMVGDGKAAASRDSTWGDVLTRLRVEESARVRALAYMAENSKGVTEDSGGRS